MPDAIQVHQLWKYYGDYAAVREFSLTIGEGACCALLGRNGAGKTTLLRILSGLSRYDRGTVRLFGEAPRKDTTRRQLGFLGHGIGVYEDLTARENLHFFTRITGLKNQTTLINTWLERVGLARVGDMPVRQFSRGMRQRLALSRTFLHSPRILVLDEPFTSLDDHAIATLTGLLLEARERGATILISTHQLREAFAIATQVALIENGSLRFSGERTPEMLDDPALLYRTHLG